MLTVANIKKEAGEYDLEVIQRLKVQRHGITHMTNLDSCIKLLDLSLARNQIVTLQGLSSCRLLERLDLSQNRISKVEGLSGLTRLRHLDLRANLIKDIADLAGLSDATALTHVFFQTNAGGAPATDKALDANPVCSNGEYEAAVTRYTESCRTSLVVVDGAAVKLRDAIREAGFGDSRSLLPDPSKTTPLPLNNWLEGVDLSVDNLLAPSGGDTASVNGDRGQGSNMPSSPVHTSSSSSSSGAAGGSGSIAGQQMPPPGPAPGGGAALAEASIQATMRALDHTLAEGEAALKQGHA